MALKPVVNHKEHISIALDNKSSRPVLVLKFSTILLNIDIRIDGDLNARSPSNPHRQTYIIHVSKSHKPSLYTRITPGTLPSSGPFPLRHYQQSCSTPIPPPSQAFPPASPPLKPPSSAATTPFSPSSPNISTISTPLALLTFSASPTATASGRTPIMPTTSSLECSTPEFGRTDQSSPIWNCYQFQLIGEESARLEKISQFRAVIERLSVRGLFTKDMNRI
ncbi:hypothetical protein RJ641_019804 [Dillenia turbinata]|uniref:Uncharacterized protein n=1 Tax=Dillenia turbinata TaxID=194707 RepID=A0AAN8YVU5_9MAGN